MSAAPLDLSAFASGRLLPIETVPDPVFAARMLGDGIAIDPDDGELRAPCAGRIVQLHAAHHACTLETAAGARLLLHIGLDTVLLAGEGFVPRVETGAAVSAGQLLIEFDPAVLARHGRPALTLLVVENGEEHPIVWRSTARRIARGDPLLQLAASGTGQDAVDAPPGDEEQAQGWAVVRHGGGLHARPAGLLASVVRRFGAAVELRARGRTANARSASAVMALAVAEG
ncbi:MAG: glucose PTS transporter subunit IIA, partial [Burkholderiales bacterium]|nr:glucose PTS transporter subunit IIA [Burkholderiales bacterium]